MPRRQRGTARRGPPLPHDNERRQNTENLHITRQHCAEAQVRVVPGGRPGSLRAAALADAVAVIEPHWTDGSGAELLPTF